MNHCKTCPELETTVNCLVQNVDTMWNHLFGDNSSEYIFTGNIGVPYWKDAVDEEEKYAIDQQDYSRGAAIITAQNPKGVFILGDADYDNIHTPYEDIDTGLFIGDVEYNPVRQESKIMSGFSSLLAQKRLFPVMGDLDYWTATGWAFDPEGDITAKMGRTYLRLFSYLPDAKRYYSVYDQKSNTEFFVLSSGRYKDEFGRHTPGFIYPTDTDFNGTQGLWFQQRASSSSAKNKVVIFHHPFSSPVNVVKGQDDQGSANVFDDFRYWDFASYGVKLIINGHSGSAYHLVKGQMNIVNSSAFARTRLGLINQGSDQSVPDVPSLYGDLGWTTQYFSYRNVGTEVPGAQIPDAGDPIDYYLVPKTQFLRLKCSNDGIIGEFVSYDSQLTDFADVVKSLKVEHTFEISSL